MTAPLRALLTVVLATTLLTTSCADDEAPIPTAQERCAADDLELYATAEIEADAEEPYDFEFTEAAGDGAIQGGAILLRLGDVEPEEGTRSLAILKLADTVGTRNLLDQLALISEDGPVTLEVVDATGVDPSARNRTDLGAFVCGPEQGTICAQLAFDGNGDGLITDADSRAFHASGGQVRVEAVDNRAQRLRLSWSLKLGANVLASDSQASGLLEGCIASNYERGPGDSWVLER